MGQTELRHNGFSFSFAITPGRPYNTPGHALFSSKNPFGANDSIVPSHYPPVLLPFFADRGLFTNYR